MSSRVWPPRSPAPFWLALLSAVLMCAACDAAGTFFKNRTSGLENPEHTISFDSSGLDFSTDITKQFPGVVVSPAMRLQPDFQCPTCFGFAGDYLSNIKPGTLIGLQPVTFQFDGVVSEAAFAMTDQLSSWTFEARLGPLLVVSATATIDYSPGVGFVGFRGIQFDRIVLKNSANTVFGIDTLQFTSVPEPATSWLALVGLLLPLHRRRHSSFVILPDFHTELAHLAVEVGAVDAKVLGGLTDVAASAGDRLLDVLLLELMRCVVEVEARVDKRRRAGGRREDEGQVFGVNLVAGR
jgi:hypothetical protein